ncbi:hypothetical protein LB503_004991 [Fusarium chuoi]|nr:hypothetical protein LB503_004991 [Fusarium chuoi]
MRTFLARIVCNRLQTESVASRSMDGLIRAGALHRNNLSEELETLRSANVLFLLTQKHRNSRINSGRVLGHAYIEMFNLYSRAVQVIMIYANWSLNGSEQAQGKPHVLRGYLTSPSPQLSYLRQYYKILWSRTGHGPRYCFLGCSPATGHCDMTSSAMSLILFGFS